jgi:SOS-response transcriptional repressor LexA
MSSDGILPGDIAILERGRDPRQGDIVIARVDEQTVIRRYEIQNGHPTLVSTNPAFPVLYFDERTELLGVVATIIRKYK